MGFRYAYRVVSSMIGERFSPKPEISILMSKTGAVPAALSECRNGFRHSTAIGPSASDMIV